MGGYLVAIGALVGAAYALWPRPRPAGVPAPRPLETVAIVALSAGAGLFLIGMLALPLAINALGLAP